MMQIVVTTAVEAIHYYPGAPDEVAFLRHPHRHMFHVKAYIEVFHEDREIEFIIVKRDLDKMLEQLVVEVENHSCEMIASTVQGYLKGRWKLKPGGYGSTPYRKIDVEVFEDGENGVRLTDSLGG